MISGSQVTQDLTDFFFFFWLCWVFIAVRGLSLVAASGGYSSLRCTGFSLRWLLLLWSTGSRRMGFSSCSMRAQQLWLTGSRAQAQQLWRTGLVALRHVGSSRTRDRTCVPCIGRRILNHCATREALDFADSSVNFGFHTKREMELKQGFEQRSEMIWFTFFKALWLLH